MTETLEYQSSKYNTPFVGCITLSKSFNQFKSTSPLTYLIRVMMRIMGNNEHKTAQHWAHINHSINITYKSSKR